MITDIRALLLDMDGTIREPILGEKFIRHPDDQRIIAGVEDAITQYPLSVTIIGITNQGGILAGHKSLDEAIQEQRKTIKLLPRINAIYLCPDDGMECWQVKRWEYVRVDFLYPHLRGTFRKPGKGMIDAACREFHLSPKKCLFVGDRPEDQGAAQAANVNFMWATEWRGNEHS